VTTEEFKIRTKRYAIRIIKVVDALPRDSVSRTLGGQLLRSGTSVAANYRASTRAKSHADFISKMGIVEEECDESLFWMEVLIESRRMKSNLLESLMHEGSELLAITVASIKTAKTSKLALRGS
jgi:four helix bundle protein